MHSDSIIWGIPIQGDVDREWEAQLMCMQAELGGAQALLCIWPRGQPGDGYANGRRPARVLLPTYKGIGEWL